MSLYVIANCYSGGSTQDLGQIGGPGSRCASPPIPRLIAAELHSRECLEHGMLATYTITDHDLPQFTKSQQNMRYSAIYHYSIL